jgi:hypothetical protein
VEIGAEDGLPPSVRLLIGDRVMWHRLTTFDVVSGGGWELMLNILCIAALLGAVVGAVRLPRRMSRPTRSSRPGVVPRSAYGEHDAHTREIDDASDDDADGGDGGDA